MAKTRLNIITGGAVPAGPLKGGLPKGGPRTVGPAASPAKSHRGAGNRSKKSYTGTVAGLGRARTGVRLGSGPKGPGAHAFHAVGTQLPARARGTFRDVEFHPAASTRPPSLMTRIGRRIGRAAAAFGL
jgi:hypothetical protein